MNNNSNGTAAIIGTAAVATVGLLGFGLSMGNNTTTTQTAEPTKTQYSAITPKTPEKEEETKCTIKGNINDKGEKIYHMPGQKYYDKTIITPSKGERWFCTEQEAISAGWRKAKV